MLFPPSLLDSPETVITGHVRVSVTSIIRATYINNFSEDHTCMSPLHLVFLGEVADASTPSDRDARGHAQLVQCRSRRCNLYCLHPIIQIAYHIPLPRAPTAVRLFQQG